jgi:threonine 3-dehydrogenase
LPPLRAGRPTNITQPGGTSSWRSSNLKERVMSDERKCPNRILITGGTGFIGSYLAMELLKRNDVAVILADRNPDRRRLTGFSQHFDAVRDRVTFVLCDVSLETHVLALFDIHEPTSVFHLGALLSAGADANPTQGFQIDLVGTRHVLEAARLYRQHYKADPLKVIFPSTIASFGFGIPPGQLVRNEDIQMPTTMYGVSKVASERLGEYYYSRRPDPWVDFRAVRFPSVIGAARGPGGTTAYSTLMVQEPVRGKAYEAYVGEDTRLDVLYIRDAVRALLGLHDADNAKLRRRVYNIAGFRINGQAPTAGDIRNAVQRARPRAAEITFRVNQPLQDIVHTFGILDDTAAREDWGWRGEWLDLEKAVADFANEVELFPSRILPLDLFSG